MTYSNSIKYALFLFSFTGEKCEHQKNLPTATEPEKGKSLIKIIFTPTPMVFILHILLYISARLLAAKTFKQPGFRTLPLDAGNK